MNPFFEKLYANVIIQDGYKERKLLVLSFTEF